MNLVTLGVNHQSAPLDVRSRFAIAPEETARALKELKHMPEVAGAAILSTCNRTDLLLAADPDQSKRILDWLHDFTHASRRYDDLFYQHARNDAVRHVFRVAAGLDSMVLGEPQVLGQLKDSYRQAQSAATLVQPLQQLFEKSFAVAKEVRFETGLGQSPVSVAYAAVRALEEVFDDLSDRTVLLIGAGETAALVGTHLKGRGLRRMVLANRNLQRAAQLALRFEASAVELSRVPEYLAEADIVVTATAAQSPIVDLDGYRQALKGRKRKLRVLIDLGVPRNVDAACGLERDTVLYAVDDLARVIEHGRVKRAQAAEQAEILVEAKVHEFAAWCRARERLEPLKQMRVQHEQMVEEALAEALKYLRQGQPAEQVIFHLAHGLGNRMQHHPSAVLHQAAAAGDAELLTAAIKLFGLDQSQS
jgi:glutamyl-tRNA reductase